MTVRIVPIELIMLAFRSQGNKTLTLAGKRLSYLFAKSFSSSHVNTAPFVSSSIISCPMKFPPFCRLDRQKCIYVSKANLFALYNNTICT